MHTCIHIYIHVCIPIGGRRTSTDECLQLVGSAKMKFYAAQFVLCFSPIHLSVKSIHPIHPTIHPSIHQSSQPASQPSINQPVHPSIHPSIHPSVQPSIQPTIN